MAFGRFFRLGLAGLLTGALLAKSVQARPRIDLSISIKNRYLGSLGFKLEEQPVVQSSATLSGNGFYGNLWTNYNQGRGTMTEIDYIGGYNRSISGFNLDASLSAFDLREQGDSRANDNIYELWVSLSRALKIGKGLVVPKMTFVKNLEGGSFPYEKGWYVDFGFDAKTKLWLPVAVDGHVPLTHNYFNDKKGPTILQGRLRFPLSIKQVTVEPFIRCQKGLKNGFDDCFDFGLNLNWGFNL